MTPQSMRLVLAALLDQGLVTRRPHPTDGRPVLFELTPAAVRARSESREARVAWLTGALSQPDAADRRAVARCRVRWTRAVDPRAPR